MWLGQALSALSGRTEGPSCIFVGGNNEALLNSRSYCHRVPPAAQGTAENTVQCQYPVTETRLSSRVAQEEFT